MQSETKKAVHQAPEIPCNEDAPPVAPGWLTLRRKDGLMRDVFDGLLSALRPDVISDVGCFNGDESARFRRLAPDARIVAFEANKKNISDFISNRDDLTNVTVENLAVCEFDGEVTFNVLEAESRASDWRRAASSLYLRADGIPYVAETVKSVRLDSYFADAIEAGDTFVLWIDVEGALERVLSGAPKTLERTLLVRAEVERVEFWLGQKMAHEVLSFFESAGFMLLADSWTSGVFDQSDVLLLNKNWLDLAAASKRNAPRSA